MIWPTQGNKATEKKPQANTWTRRQPAKVFGTSVKAHKQYHERHLVEEVCPPSHAIRFADGLGRSLYPTHPLGPCLEPLQKAPRYVGDLHDAQRWRTGAAEGRSRWADQLSGANRTFMGETC